MSIDMFIDPDPRSEPPPQGGEQETLSGFLRWQRETSWRTAGAGGGWDGECCSSWCSCAPGRLA
ncbi:MAG: hypothetical protein ACRDPF_27870 [Streptosporangiaceae bacterium]